MESDLNRFLKAQESDYEIALSEVRAGAKRSHWMWYIFPQIGGLGFSAVANYYAIKNMEEAKMYLNHPILGSRLREISSELLKLAENDAHAIFGFPDDLKLKSCMTLFLQVDDDENSVFKAVLDKFFQGKVDDNTLSILNDRHRKENSMD